MIRAALHFSPHPPDGALHQAQPLVWSHNAVRRPDQGQASLGGTKPKLLSYIRANLGG